ncbi:aminotransferase class V-fold PLP-dependent enzyme [Bacillus sp. ISL-7]|uniref:aminotransferase class V-fold PLP-dependent enzyme n=1 Tax=Bacillus sp. ISL-7 TaxID=2819136 RepID=UPI001BE4E88C|nr:aminotransferase class V-fold PLP-dependent enzyme [Bacillus sp. ISL-7]MBT2733794.1 aminotransferase class V-fold PLP-dependent enzyme [Bacillus sp. ISL-7]
MTFPFTKEREQFPILNKMTQLSSCSQSAMSIQVKAAINEYVDSWNNEGMDWIGWMNHVEQAKASFAQLINASPDEIAVLSSVSDSASSIASALSFTSKRNKIFTTEIDFPSIGHVWLAQQERGAQVQFIPSENNTVPLEHYEQFVDEQTIITSIPHVSYYNGFKQDLKKIASIVHQKGSYLFVDAYQSAGCVQIDVKEMDIDFLATGSQKYLLGIPGIAFLYVKKEIANELKPAVTGWFGRINPFDFNVKLLDYAEGARRFETGTPPMVNAYAADTGIKILLKIGVENIENYLRTLSHKAITHAKELGLKIASPENLDEKAANTAIFVGEATKFENQMKERGFIVSARNDVIRIAPHFYNTENEVIAAIDMLAELMKDGK